MPDSPTINQVSNVNTTDPDLIELAGHHAYKKDPLNSNIVVNGKSFKVIHTNYNLESGLDALTVKNLQTNEITVVFVGSQQMVEDWGLTNSKLIGNKVPQQIKDAQAYFDYVNENVGPVASVTGNSLGGGLTNAVAINNPQVRAVTLNSAILPGGMVDPKGDYSHIHNYYSKYDFLTSTEEAIRLGHRIPGNKYSINNGLPLFGQIGSNHTGYVDVAEDGSFKVEVGIKGQPGYGFIHVGADDHVVTSLWTGAPLYSGFTPKIEINEENMLKLAAGIEHQVTGKVTNVREYLGNSVAIVENESANFSKRVNQLQDTFQQMFDDLAADPVFNGISETGTAIKGFIDDLISVVNTAEERCRFLNSVLNSKPAELIEFITNTDISVESIFAPIRNFLNQIKENIDSLIGFLHHIVYQELPALFQGGTDAFVDAVVGEFNAHYNIINKNKEDVYKQLTDYQTQVQDVATSFHNQDRRLASAISGGGSMEYSVNPIRKTDIFTIESSPYMKLGAAMKEIQVELAHSQIKNVLSKLAQPLLTNLASITGAVNLAINGAIFTVQAAKNVSIYGSPLTILLSLFTDYEQRVKKAANSVLEPLRDAEEITSSLSQGLFRVSANLPQMIENFKPYIDTAIFERGNYQNVRLYNLAATAHLEEMELIFADIIQQLSDEKANSIEETLDVSKSVKTNLELLREQVERCTL